MFKREIVVDGVTGYIVNPLNVEVMADRITGCYWMREKRDKGEAGYWRVPEHLMIEIQAPKVIALYRQVLESSSPLSGPEWEMS